MLLISQNKRHIIDSQRITSIHLLDDECDTVIIAHTENSKYLFGRYPDEDSAKEQIVDLACAWGLQKAFAFK